MENSQHIPVLIIDHEIKLENSGGLTIRKICDELVKLGLSVMTTTSTSDGLDLLKINEEISCIIVNWETREELSCSEFILQLRKQNETIPILIITHRHHLKDISTTSLKDVSGYIWKLEDTPHFIAGRIEQLVKEYHDAILPPFFKTLKNYVAHYKYAWHTPGHMRGAAFLKSPIGHAFYNFYGENVFSSDLSVSVPELGSLMEHTGVNGEAEKEAAKNFGADYTFFVTNGTSTANKIVMHSCVTSNDIIIVDRNCHKSLQHAITMTGATPIYFMPARNAYGIIGGIHHNEFDAPVIQEKIKANPLIKNKKQKLKLAVITNSTYDGLTYDVVYIKEKLQNVVSNLHFDEAWYPYAKFHELYNGRFGMSSLHEPQHPTIYCTQSTHKLLAAFSQASMIHIKDGSNKIDPERFNEAFMMHTSTSPQYSIIASLDVANKMMEGQAGRNLVHESITEANGFRKKLVQIRNELIKKKDNNWFYNVWQPTKIKSEKLLKKSSPFYEADDDVISTDQASWLLHPEDKWHGYHTITDNYMMLDPIKVSMLTPGIKEDGTMDAFGIPAPLLAKFLMNRGIVDEKTGFYVFLLLFSIGVNRGKSGTLLTELLQFKKLFDKNAQLDQFYPELVKSYPESYANMTIQKLADKMHSYLKEKNITKITSQVFDRLPDPVMTPNHAYQELVKGHVEKVKLDKLMNRVPAVMLVPYPPGIPIIMPGERFTKDTRLIIDYLKVLEDFDNLFPGFETETHGVNVEVEDGKKVYYVSVLM